MSSLGFNNPAPKRRLAETAPSGLNGKNRAGMSASFRVKMTYSPALVKFSSFKQNDSTRSSERLAFLSNSAVGIAEQKPQKPLFTFLIEARRPSLNQRLRDLKFKTEPLPSGSPREASYRSDHEQFLLHRHKLKFV